MGISRRLAIFVGKKVGGILDNVLGGGGKRVNLCGGCFEYFLEYLRDLVQSNSLQF